MKTSNPEHVGKHAFEVAGLGLAPFRFVGLSENVIRYPDGSSKAGGTCDYCGTGIASECHILSADGQWHKVGCDCIRKVGDEGLFRAFKTSPEYRKHQRDMRRAKDLATREHLDALIADNAARLAALPHPRGFTDRKTGTALTMMDQISWMLNHCGAAGRGRLLKQVKTILTA